MGISGRLAKLRPDRSLVQYLGRHDHVAPAGTLEDI